ncbi:MAG TPA: hypothetical protein PK916_07715 [Bacteroidota bacterium]|nr:hypothetical protein [Bacteroidota bacterium]
MSTIASTAFLSTSKRHSGGVKRFVPVLPAIITALLLCMPANALAQMDSMDAPVPLPAWYNPVTVLVNMGFDITQLDRYRRDVLRYPYARAAGTVFSNLGKPAPLIKRYGWERFLRHEILPLEFSDGASWWPNYQLHLVGGGYTWARLATWYERHGAPAPGWLAAGTVMLGHVLNEVMENNGVEGELIDPIADLYVFDVAGILLFTSGDVRRFFSETVRLHDWSLQPSMGVSDGVLHNAGQYFAARYHIPGAEHWAVLYVFGLNGLLGVSHTLNDGSTISLAGGLRSQAVRRDEEHPLRLTADLTWSAGAFLDRDGVPMASLLLSGISSNVATLNLYPGMLRIGGCSPGLWCSLSTRGRVRLGLVTQWGLGLAN